MPLDGIEVILGKWKLEKNENFESYLSAMGIGMIKRKLANKMNSTVEIIKAGENRIRIVTKGPKDSDHEFPLDEEMDEKDPFDNDVKVKVTWDPVAKVMTTTAEPASKNAKKSVVTRSIIDDQLLMQINLPQDRIECKRFFKRSDS